MEIPVTNLYRRRCGPLWPGRQRRQWCSSRTSWRPYVLPLPWSKTSQTHMRQSTFFVLEQQRLWCRLVTSVSDQGTWDGDVADHSVQLQGTGDGTRSSTAASGRRTERDVAGGGGNGVRQGARAKSASTSPLSTAPRPRR
jgi:hypothetical protein